MLGLLGPTTASGSQDSIVPWSIHNRLDFTLTLGRYDFLTAIARLWYHTPALGKAEKNGDEEMRLTATFASMLILFVLLAGIASASEAESGNELYELLASESPYSRFVGLAYILGVIDTTHSLNKVWRLPAQWTLPPRVTRGRILEVVRKYLEQHPEEREQTAYILVNMALGNSFPPKK